MGGMKANLCHMMYDFDRYIRSIY